jgi:hypothetical protein
LIGKAKVEKHAKSRRETASLAKPSDTRRSQSVPCLERWFSSDTRYLSSSKVAMNAASRYWTMIGIDAAGKRKSEEIPSAKAFFSTSFPEYTPRSEVPDALIQRQLLHWMGEATEQHTQDTNKRFLSELCLVCFISTQIERVCLQLEAQFGAEHGFTFGNLLSRVLDEDNRRFRKSTKTPVSSYQSLPQEILQTFNPEQSSLATWTTRLVKHHRELNNFLLEHGVYLVSDWAILNDTNGKQLQRILLQFHQLTSVEIQQANQLLESYHAVYRTQRLKQRKEGIKGQCLPPTREQLEQIAQCLFTQTSQRFRPETVMAKLQDLASRLREYRIYVRSGSLPTESINTPVSTNTSADRTAFRDFIDDRNTTDEQTEFLLSYRQKFLACLDQAISQVTEEQVTKLQRKDPDKAQKFLTALQLFHCQGMSMGEIAKEVNLQAQFHVSRLLKLKAFRSDIQQKFLLILGAQVIDEAKNFTDPERLETLREKIEEALEDQVKTVVHEAAIEAATATGTKNQTTATSLFAERLCCYLDTRRP